MDIQLLRDQYEAKFGKKAPNFWSEEVLKMRIEDGVIPAKDKVSGDAERTVVKPVAQEGVLQLTQEQFDAKIKEAVAQAVGTLRGENAELKQVQEKIMGGWGEFVPPAKRNKTAKLKVYRESTEDEGGLIFYVQYLKTIFDEETRRKDLALFKIKVIDRKGEVKEYEITGKDLASIQNVVTVELVKETSRTLRKVDGETNRPTTNKEGYPVYNANSGQGYGMPMGIESRVPLEVLRTETDVVVKTPLGQEFEMKAEHLNN